jgi:PTS system galactitol-specific IIA component
MSALVGFQEELISTGITAADWKEAVRQTAACLLEHGYAREEYVRAVIEREKLSPTGLPTSPFGVAMPHAGSDLVLQTGIAVSVLEQPVTFSVMGSPGEEVEVSIIFLIAMKDPDNQVRVLQRLCGLFQSSELLEAIRRTDSRSEISALLNEGL